jgi:hypothetical protein
MPQKKQRWTTEERQLSWRCLVLTVAWYKADTSYLYYIRRIEGCYFQEKEYLLLPYDEIMEITGWI